MMIEHETLKLPQEPVYLSSEKEFQKHLVDAIHIILKQREIDYCLLENFGLDVCIFLNQKDYQVVRFLEMKFYSGQRPDGVGFGNSRGEGPQVDLLINSDMRRFNSSIRWSLAVKEGDHTKYAFFTCEDAKNSAMEGVKRGKQNNLKISKIIKEDISWENLLKEVTKFIKKRRKTPDFSPGI